VNKFSLNDKYLNPVRRPIVEGIVPAVHFGKDNNIVSDMRI
jgi:hypothetical protein